MLRPLHDHPAISSPNLIVGLATPDDAGVYRLGPGPASMALVQTVDFFTPIVDEPYDWGRIAAANAVSDVYAMGGEPLTALSLVGWPRGELSFDLLGEVVRGGADVMAEAGCTIVGGHSIDDQEPKFGFAVTGLVAEEAMVSKAGARPGDVLVLTKPIGTGIVSTAIKRGACSDALHREAVETMVRLNRDAARVMASGGVDAVTDITGFGLLGHLREVLVASGVSARVRTAAVPVLPGVAELAAAGYYPGGSERNLAAVGPFVDGSEDEAALRLLCDAQTSGGLLMAVPTANAAPLVAALREGDPAAAVIGELTDGEPGRVELV